MAKEVNFNFIDSNGRQNMGTNYNFNISGNVLGIYSVNDKDYLFTNITKSYGNNCMVGTVDVREVVTDGINLFNSNNISEEAMFLMKLSSSVLARDFLSSGRNISEYLGGKNVQIYESSLNGMVTDETLSVMGIQPQEFEQLKEKQVSRFR